MPAPRPMTVVAVVLLVMAALTALSPRPANAQTRLAAPPAAVAEERKITVEESGPVRKLLERIFVEAGASYVIGSVPSDEATISVHNVPFRDALAVFLQAAAPDLTYRVEKGVYVIVRKEREAPAAAGTPTPAMGSPAGPVVMTAPATSASAVLTALQVQLANLRADRAATLVGSPQGSVEIARIDARIAAFAKEIARLRSEARAGGPIDAIRTRVAALQEQKARMIGDGYTPTRDAMAAVDQQIAALEQTIADDEAP